MVVLVFVAFFAGLVTAVSPCVLPILPIVLATGADGDRRRPYLVIAGLIASFSFFTLASVQIISALGLPSSALRDIAIAILFVFGLTLLVPAVSAVFERATGRLQRAGAQLMGRSTPGSLASATGAGTTFGMAAAPGASNPQKRGSIAGGLLTGVGLGLVWTPCAGPILGAITSLAVTSAGSWSTLTIVLAYSIGAGLPLLAIAQGGRAMMSRLRLRSASVWATRVFGVVVIVTAGLMAVGADTAISADLTSALPNWTDTLQALERSNPVQAALSEIQGHSQATGQPASNNASGLADAGSAPEFTGIDHWLNSQPLTLAQLRGKVVLVDFWTYSCINCIRTLPYVEGWYQKYAAAGFVVVGVHAPEFAFEHDTGNVSAAIARFGITYPVAQDNEFGTWHAYNNQYWPADYLIDATGHIRDSHFGEGDYDKTEANIRALLKEAGISALPTASAANGGVPIGGSQTPETYLGSARAAGFQGTYPSDGTQTLAFPARLDRNAWGLDGTWDVSSQDITASKAGDKLELSFQARDVYLVMSAPGSVTAHVTIAGAGAPAQGTEDVSASGELTVSSSRLYHLVHLPAAGQGTVTITFDTPGAEAFAFTFGS
jgi:cytochrome c biogenesis protein CcdA/thiol-disulfide isomerase/thioredoxin